MAEEPKFRNVDSAPFIYFDEVSSLGVLGGAVQVELAGRVIHRGEPAIVEYITTARLRCSPAAALALRDNLNAALNMLNPPSEAPKPPEGTAIN